jgi:hypothetical protein
MVAAARPASRLFREPARSEAEKTRKRTGSRYISQIHRGKIEKRYGGSGSMGKCEARPVPVDCFVMTRYAVNWWLSRLLSLTAIHGEVFGRRSP